MAAADGELAVLREQAFRLTGIVERSPTVVFRWRIAPGWPVEFVSANVRQFGYAQEDFLTGRVSWVGITHPDDVPRLEREVAGYLAAKQHEFRQSYRLLDAAGVYRWIEDRNLLIYDQTGQLTHVEGLINDVTEHKAVEAILEAAIEHSPIATIVTDRHHRIIRFNRAAEALTGYSHGELPDIGTWVDKLYPEPAERARVRQDGANLQAGRRLQFAHYRMTRKDGEKRLVCFHVSQFQDGLVAQMLDVTEQCRLEQAVVAAVDRERMQLSQALHDVLGQDLVGLSFMVGALAGKVSRDCPGAVGDLRRIAELVQHSLGQARSLAQGLCILGLQSETFGTALAKLVRQAEELYGLRVEFHFDAALPPPGEAAAGHLYFIAQEALSNAARHAQATAVQVCWQRQGDDLLLSISDDGCGLPPVANGNGLGLAIMRHRMDLLGGYLLVDDLPAGGTRIRCLLPLLVASPVATYTALGS